MGAFLASIGTAASCALAQSRPQPIAKPDNQATNDQNVRRDAALEAITKELSAIREQAARIEQAQAARDAKPGTPIYSNWVLIGVTGGAVVAAFLTLGALRKQVDANADAAKAARRNATAAMRSAKTARDAFIADQRPWAPLDVAVASPLAYEAGTGSAGPKWRVTLSCRIRSVGKTPAFAAKVTGRIVPWVVGPNVMEDGGRTQGGTATDVEAILKEIAAPTDRVAVAMSKFGARILFPDETDIDHLPITLDEKAVEEALRSDYYAGNFILVIAVTYGDQFSEIVHSTAKAFHFYRRPWPTARIELTGETVPLDELALSPFPVHVDIAT